MYTNTLKFLDSADFVFLQKTQVTLAPILEPILDVGFINKQGLQVLLEIFVTYFIDLKREFIEKRARVFRINAFGYEVIEIRYHLFIHIPKEIVNITSLFFVSCFSHTTG